MRVQGRSRLQEQARAAVGIEESAVRGESSRNGLSRHGNAKPPQVEQRLEHESSMKGILPATAAIDGVRPRSILTLCAQDEPCELVRQSQEVVLWSRTRDTCEESRGERREIDDSCAISGGVRDRGPVPGRSEVHFVTKEVRGRLAEGERVGIRERFPGPNQVPAHRGRHDRIRRPGRRPKRTRLPGKWIPPSVTVARSHGLSSDPAQEPLEQRSRPILAQEARP